MNPQSKAKKKYKIPVYAIATAEKIVTTIECDSYSEYKKEFDKLNDSGDFDGPRANISNDFEIGDSELDELKEEDMKYYERK